MIQAHLLDVGKRQYGDSILLRLGDRTVLIDGGNPSSYYSTQRHASIQQQLGQLLGGDPPYHISLLVVTHAHNDHIGCLPKLVEEEWITVDWALVADPTLGWGVDENEDSIPGADQELEVQTMLAALREEPMIEASQDDVAEFLLDSQTLRSRYLDMIDELEESGTTVVSYQGGNETADLLADFEDIGLRILGPDRRMLYKCALRIQKLGRDFLDLAAKSFAEDTSRSEVELYQRLLQAGDSAGIDASGIGAALNCMSLVLLFEIDDVKLLMTGDMQFTDPGVPSVDPDVPQDRPFEELMDEMRRRIANDGPFDLYKIGHHGSHNSFDQSVLDELAGTVNFAVSTGRLSGRHPSSSVLRLLRENVDDIFWVRTDRNGKCSFYFEDDPPSIEIDRGIFTDWRRNFIDTGQAAATPLPSIEQTSHVSGGATPESSSSMPKVASAEGDPIEVITRVPHQRTKVSVTIEVFPPGDDKIDVKGFEPVSPITPRSVRLAIVTDRQELAANIGAPDTNAIIADVEQRGDLVIDIAGLGPDPVQCAQRVRERTAAADNLDGVVIVGGYDVVPSLVLDVLPNSLRQHLGTNTGDPDDFIVWSDDIYGDVDGDEIAELPVSRIPDGQSANLVRRALASTPPKSGQTRIGVRNVKRPFADGIFDIMTGDGEILSSHPAVHTAVPSLSQDHVYLMLHGSYNDATEFHGENVPGGIPAVRLENIPDATSSVVFCGCCWGALIVDKPAVRAGHEETTARTAADSIPMRFLDAGANAFVGCTGVHYSPIQQPFQFFGGPMHEAFWRRSVVGEPPAKALFNAKKDYIQGMFHGMDDAIEHAIEYKILRQFTCLGLGW